MDEGVRYLRISVIILAGVLIVAGIGSPVYKLLVPNVNISLLQISILGSIILAEGVCVLLALRRGSTAGLLCVLLLGSLSFAIIGSIFINDRMGALRSCKPLALLVRQQAPPDAIVASFEYDQTLPFYAGRRIVVVGGRDELEFGSKQGDQSAWFIDLPAFKVLWEGNQQVFVVVRRNKMDHFYETTSVPGRVVGESPSRLLIANHQ